MKAGLSVLVIGSPVLCGKHVFYEHESKSDCPRHLLLKVQFFLDNGDICL